MYNRHHNAGILYTHYLVYNLCAQPAKHTACTGAKHCCPRKPRYTSPTYCQSAQTQAMQHATPHLCCSLHNCLALFAGNIVRNLSSIPSAQHHESCIKHLAPHSYRRLSRAYFRKLHMTHLLCIIRSSSSLTFETTNLKKPASNDHCKYKAAQRNFCILKRILPAPAPHTIGKHIPGLLV